MKDNPEFNIQFVGIIERHRCIYDHSTTEYANRNFQEKTWKKISKDVNESVPDCKERWRNLRGSYTRYLKQRSTPSTKMKQPYYLANYMAFLRPFTKTRQSKSNIETAWAGTINNSNEFGDSESDYNHEDEVHSVKHEVDLEGEMSLPSSTSSGESPWNTHFKSSLALSESSCDVHRDSHQSSSISVNTEKSTNSKRAASIEDINKSDVEYFQGKRARVKKDLNKHEYEDPDISFLKSILPDMKKMNDSQKRRFKIGILSSAGSILEENTNESCFPSMDT